MRDLKELVADNTFPPTVTQVSRVYSDQTDSLKVSEKGSLGFSEHLTLEFYSDIFYSVNPGQNMFLPTSNQRTVKLVLLMINGLLAANMAKKNS